MKRTLPLVLLTTLLFSSFQVFAATYTSVAAGAWSNPFTWDALGASGTPGAADDVNIGHNVSLTTAQNCKNLSINVGGILFHGGYTLTVNGNYICNGTHNSSGTLSMSGGPTATLQVPNTAAFNFSGTIVISGTKTFTATTDIQYVNCNITILSDDTLINNGTLWIAATVNGSNAGSVLQQGNNARLYVQRNMMSVGDIIASASGNIMYYWAETVNVRCWDNDPTTPFNDVFMRCNSGKSLTMETDFNVDGFFYQNTSTSKVFTNGHTVNLAGNYRSFGAQFPTGSGDVTFDGGSTQQIRNETTMTEIEFDDVTIDGSEVLPILDLVIHGDLTINNSKELDLTAANYPLTLEGDLTNDGTFDTRSSKITASGTSIQSWSGSSTTTFRDLEVNKSGGSLTMSSGTFNIDSVFTMTAGTFDPNGKMTIQSDATRTARIAPVAGGSITGSVNVERYISTRNADFQNFASPCNSTILDWDNEIFMSGVGGADGNAAGPDGIFYSVKKYNELTDSFTDITSTGETMDAGKGFQLYLGDDTNTFAATTINTVGIPYQGDQAFPLTFTAANGWHLTGNPFASWIEWDSIYNATSNIDNNFYVLDAASGSYASYGSGDRIPPTQGIWVHATSATTLNIEEVSKCATEEASTFYRMPNRYQDALRFTIVEPTRELSHTSVVRFSNHGVDAYDKEDALFLESPIELAPSFTSFSKDGQELNINTRSALTRSVEIPMKATVGADGTYTLKVEGLDNVSRFSCIVLEDKLTGKAYDLLSDQELQLEISASENTTRFVLHMSVEPSGFCKTDPASETNDSQVDVTAQQDGVAVQIALTEEQDVRIFVYNAVGQLVSSVEEKQSVLNARYEINVPQASGIYTVVVESASNREVNRVYID